MSGHARRAWAVAALLWAAIVSASAAEPFAKHNVVLPQPSSVLEARVISLDAMAQYIRSVEAAAKEGVLAARSTRPAAGFIVLAVQPGERSRVWLDFDSPPSFETGQQLVAKIGAVKPFEVRNGPVVVALKVGSYAFPREQSALMSGIASGSWSLVNFILLNAIGAGVTIAGVTILPGANLINAQRWEAIFWIIALLPAIGVALWLFLSREQAAARA